MTPAFLQELFGLLAAGENWVLLTGLLFASGLVVALWRRPWFSVLAISWIGLPLFIIWLTHPHHILILRYFLFMQPIYLLLIALGLVQLARVCAAALARIFFPADRQLPSTMVLVGLATILAALFLVPAWRGYWIEKVTDWSAVCSYVHHESQAGDVVTGDSYIQEIMAWCLKPGDNLTFAVPGTYALSALTTSNRAVWYMAIDPTPTETAFLQRYFQAVPHSAWGNPSLHLALSNSDRLQYPVAEHLAQIYVHHPR